MKLVALIVIAFLQLGCFQAYSDGDFNPTVTYNDGNWTGNVVCHYYNDPYCALSMHVQGRRITKNSSKSNENVFVSCFDTDTSIGLNLNYFHYKDVQDYVCLNDITQEYKHNWLIAYPYMEIEGVEAVGSLVRLTCNSFPGAPLYWMLPGTAQDNNDVKITTNNNLINSSISAFFVLKDNDNFAEYKCCIKMKSNQLPPLSCTSHTFHFSDVKLLSTYADYSNGNSLAMQCVYVGETTPSVSQISWRRCDSDYDCSTMPSYDYSIITDEVSHTLTTTFTQAYSSTYTIGQCLYNNNVSHIFNVSSEDYAPRVIQSGQNTYYSDVGYSVALFCSVDACPEPNFIWTKNNTLEFTNGSEIITNDGSYTIEIQHISTTEWQTTLVIYPYDVSIHNVIYTCTANNSLGQQSVHMNTHEGPENLELKLVSIVNSTNETSAVKAICTFQAFPYPSNYDVNVIIAEEVNFTTTVAYDELRYHAAITVDFNAHIDVFPATIECRAFNPFEVGNQMQAQITVPYNNITSDSN